jgi:hypothetical protein
MKPNPKLAENLRELADVVEEGDDFLNDIQLSIDTVGHVLAYTEGEERVLTMVLEKAVREALNYSRDDLNGEDCEHLNKWAEHFEKLANRIRNHCKKYPPLKEDK